MINLICGDVIAELKKLPDKSVQCCVTSPPYWGLRDYGLPPSVWGGDPECGHEWVDTTYTNSRGNDDTAGKKQRSNQGSEGWRNTPRNNATCGKCGAWLGC